MTDLAQGGAGGANGTGGSGPPGGGAPGGSPAGGNSDRSNGGSAHQPHNQGYSPAAAARAAQQQSGVENRIDIDGNSYHVDDVRAALSHRAEQEIRRQSLPSDPNGYEVRLPANFQAPQGVNFEFNMNDPAIAEARKVAHARGIDQETFSDMLGVYAATKIGEQTHLATARAAELSKLGSAAPNRIAAIQTWLKARAGADAEVLVNQLAQFPHARMVSTFERLMKAFAGQGGAEYQNTGRTVEDTSGRIPGYDGMSFAQKRAFQMQTDPRVRASMQGGARGE